MTDSSHIFYECVLAKQVWAVSNLYTLIRKSDLLTFSDWIRTKFYELDMDKAEEFVMMLWSLWTARNNKIFQGKVFSPIAIAEYALGTLHEFRKANIIERPMLKDVDLNQEPSLLPEGFIKINFDAAFFPKLGFGGAGMVARDKDGKFLMARSIKLFTHADVDTMEAIALRKVVDWIEEYSFIKVLIAEDSQNVISLMKHPREDISLIALMVEDSRAILENECEWQAVWTCRRKNLVAHLLVI